MVSTRTVSISDKVPKLVILPMDIILHYVLGMISLVYISFQVNSHCENQRSLEKRLLHFNSLMHLYS